MKGLLCIFALVTLFDRSVSLVVGKEISTSRYNAQATGHSVNSDADLTTPEMIEKAGYPVETHVATTEDGYILTMHRIPGKDGSLPVFLQHGFLCSSADWIMSGKDKGLAYILADHGFDVWLGNFRGNTYSKGHVNLTIHDSNYWKFSWHEHGIYDLPAMISYVANKNNGSLTYIGHSMGTTSFYVMASIRRDIAKLVHIMFSLAPVAFIDHLRSPIRYLAPLSRDPKLLERFIGKDAFLPQNSLIKFLSKYGCDQATLEKELCANIYFVLCGFDGSQYNYTLTPIFLNHTPAGSSAMTAIHYMQEMVSGKFRRYDFGPKKNMEVYRQIEPPDYDLSKISVPIVMFYADNDWLASLTDVRRLYEKLPTAKLYRIPYAKFNHIDFLWAIDAPELLYGKIVSMIKKTYDKQIVRKHSRA